MEVLLEEEKDLVVITAKGEIEDVSLTIEENDEVVAQKEEEHSQAMPTNFDEKEDKKTKGRDEILGNLLNQ